MMKKGMLLLIAAMLVFFGVVMKGEAKAESSVRMNAQSNEIVLDVTEARFGAVPDDGQDDWTAIQNALEYAKQTNETLVVRIPNGHYTISKALWIDSNTKLMLESGAVISCQGSTHLMLLNGRRNMANWPGGYQRSENIVVQGGKWDGNGQGGNVHSDLMFFAHAQNITIQGAELVNCCGNHFIEFAGVSNGTINNCEFRDFVRYNGINYDTDEERSDVTAISEVIQIDYTSGIGTDDADKPFDNTLSQYITVTNCSFENCMSGVGNHHFNDRMMPGLKITHNVFTNMNKDCINFYSFGSATISDNKATNVRRFLYSHTSNATEDMAIIENNEILNTNAPFVHDENAMFVVQSSNLTFRNNKIQGFKNGFNLDRSQNIVISGNTISDVANDGIYTSLSSAQIQNNQITGCKNDGIHLDRVQQTEVTGNAIDNVSVNGIFAIASDVQLQSNMIANCGSYNIATYKRENKACTGTIEGNTYDKSYGIKNLGGMTRGVNIWKDHEQELRDLFIIYYHLNENAPASDRTTIVSLIEGAEKPALITVRELGFSVEGKLFSGWKIFKEDTAEWRTSDKKWVKALSAGESYFYYKDGTAMDQIGDEGSVIHLYAQWGDQGSDYLPGDVNGDGLVDGRDAIRLKKYLKKMDTGFFLEKNADVNRDNKIDDSDLTMLLEYLAGIRESL